MANQNPKQYCTGSNLSFFDLVLECKKSTLHHRINGLQLKFASRISISSHNFLYKVVSCTKQSKSNIEVLQISNDNIDLNNLSLSVNLDLFIKVFYLVNKLLGSYTT